MFPEWAYQWNIMFNLEITKQAQEVIFSKKTVKPFHLQVFYNEVPVERSFSQKLLGLHLDPGGRPPLPLFENRKKYPDFGKEGPDCIHYYVKFSIQNVVLTVSRRKNSENFPCGAFFSCALTKRLSKCPNSTKPPLP